MRLARYEAVVELYNEISATRDLARLASVLATRLKFVADVRAFRLIVASVPQDETVPRGADIVWMFSGAKGFKQATFADLSEIEREQFVRAVPVDWERSDDAQAGALDALHDFRSSQRVTSLPVRLPGRAAVMLLSPIEAFSELERKLILGLTVLLCNIVSTIGTEREHLEKLERRRGQLEDVNAELSGLVEDLSTVIVPVWDGVLLTPIVGRLDSARMTRMMARLLARVGSQRTREVIIDLTGASTIDGGVVDQLSRTQGALRLMGARCTFVGMRASIAQQLAYDGALLGPKNFRASVLDALTAHILARGSASS